MDDIFFMNEALRLAERAAGMDEVPVGAVLVLAIVVGLFTGGFNLGIDFTGGTLITLDLGDGSIVITETGYTVHSKEGQE